MFNLVQFVAIREKLEMYTWFCVCWTERTVRCARPGTLVDVCPSCFAIHLCQPARQHGAASPASWSHWIDEVAIKEPQTNQQTSCKTRQKLNESYVTYGTHPKCDKRNVHSQETQVCRRSIKIGSLFRRGTRVHNVFPTSVVWPRAALRVIMSVH